jgi:hypothetical protein
MEDGFKRKHNLFKEYGLIYNGDSDRPLLGGSKSSNNKKISFT